MTAKTEAIPKYALLDGSEFVLLEAVPHAITGQAVCIFENASSERFHVSEAEWRAGAAEFANHAVRQNIVTSDSPARDKIALFRSLFRGRDDVYAHGYAKKDGGIGYSPACANERSSACPRWTGSIPRAKCADCPARRFVPVNHRAIVEHFKGERRDLRDVMGLFVLSADCKTWVLIADFDEREWKRETALYRDECRSLGLFPAVERSRSGNGAHVWVFFSEPVDAELARNLGFLLITRAMSKAEGMTFKSYDRLFPTQSSIPKGGFGNLIAPPFQGRAQRHSNSVFVDDDFIAFPDQWRFLSSVEKVTSAQVREMVESSPYGPTGQLAFATASSRSLSLGATPPSISLAADPASSQIGFPSIVHVRKANMLLVEKTELSQRAKDQVRRLAAFGNPEFFKAQAMRRSVRGIPRIIWCGDEDERFIKLPRGCEQKLVDLLEERGCACAFDDERVSAPPVRAEFTGNLRDSQRIAADALLRHDNGILMAPTGFGKTVIGAYLIGKLKMRTLVIVPNATLIGQWKEMLGRLLDIEDDRPQLLTRSGKVSKRKRPVIGQVGGGKSAPSGIVDVATFQSLSYKDDLGIPNAKQLVANYELVICDECHHGAAPNLELVMKAIKARRVYGLSATPKRSDGLERIIYMHCGPVRYRVDLKEQAAEQGFERVLRPRFTRVRLAGLEPGSSFNQVVEALCDHGARNAMIARDAADAAAAGRMPLLLTSRRAHAIEMADMIEAMGARVFLLIGGGTRSERRKRMEQVRHDACPGCAIVATGSYIGEGFDLPCLDTLLLASPYSWEGAITQYSGRLHRKSEGKRDVIVYDYVDASVPMLERMYKRRLKAFAKLGYAVDLESEAEGPGVRIVTDVGWFEELEGDVSRASSKVLISASYADPKLVQALEPSIMAAIARGVEVCVVLKKAVSDSSASIQNRVVERLARIGCSVSIADSPLVGVAVFDREISWYGTLPLLARSKLGDCSLRIDDAEVAVDLGTALRDSCSSTTG